MENEVKQRLIDFLRYKKMSQCKFERACGLSNGYINNLKKSIGTEKLQNIIGAFPDLNIEWLLCGKGEMLNSNNGNTIITGDINGNRNNVVTRVPFVGKNLAASPEFSIRELIKSNQQLVRQQDELIAEVRKQNERQDKLMDVIINKIN